VASAIPQQHVGDEVLWWSTMMTSANDLRGGIAVELETETRSTGTPPAPPGRIEVWVHERSG
jgi:hypothetical protein